MKQTLNANAQAVLCVVQAAKNHPTALEVYEAVKKAKPRMGLASVYRILHHLVEQGYIKNLSYGDESCRYDAQTSRHDHAVCTECGALLDLPLEVSLSQQVLQNAAQAAGIELGSHEVRLYGRCASCQAQALHS